MRHLLAIALALLVSNVSAVEIEVHDKLMDHGGGHLMDMGGGMVMGQNTDRIPDGCSGIAGEEEITVHAGHKYAEKFPGRMYAFDVQEYRFEPCTKLTVNFINEDSVRHQWMMHGLPKYLYHRGMFHLEVTGPGKITGTLILPPGDNTYLVHCDLAQHMEKGMKGQMIVGKGKGELPSIPGVTDNAIVDDYTAHPAERSINPAEGEVVKGAAIPADGATDTTVQAQNDSIISGVTIIGLALGLLVMPFLMKRFKGMSIGEAIGAVFVIIKDIVTAVINLVMQVFNALFSGNK